MKKPSLKIITLFSLFLSLGFFFGVQYASAYDFPGQSGLDTTSGQAGYSTTSKTASLELIIAPVIQIVLSLVGVIFLVLMIYAGITWMTAAGNDQKAEKAKNILTESTIGLVIVMAAYAITYFVSNYFSANTLIN